MGSLFFLLVGLVVILLLAYCFYKQLHINHAFAPFTAFCFVILIMFAFALANQMQVGIVVIYIIVIIWIGLILRKSGFHDLCSFIKRPAILFFLVFSLVAAIVFIFGRHYMTVWDEYSHWGPFYKAISMTDQLHIFYDNNLVHGNYAQATTLWYYFFDGFHPTYSEAMPACTMAIALNASLATLLGKFRWKRFAVTLIAMVSFGFFFYLFPETTPYDTIMVDCLVGAMFGALLLMCIVDMKGETGRLIALGICLFAFIQLKDVALAFAAFVILAYVVLSWTKKRKNFIEQRAKINPFITYIILGGMLSVVILISKGIWDFTIAIHSENIVYSVIAESDVSPVAAVLDFLRGNSDFGNRLAPIFAEGICTLPVFLNAGLSLKITAAILGITGILGTLILRKRKKSGWLTLNILMIFFCILYTAAIFVIYLSIFPPDRALVLGSYSRYISSFVIGWVLVIAGMFSYHEDLYCKPWYKSKAVIATCAVGILVLSQMITGTTCYLKPQEPQYNESNFANYKRAADSLNDYVEDDKVVYVISQGSDGLIAYFYHYYLWPQKVILPDKRIWTSYPDPSLPENEGRGVYHRGDILYLINEIGADYLLVDHSDAYLEQEIGDLFSDGLASVQDGTAALYEKSDSSLGESRFELVATAEKTIR